MRAYTILFLIFISSSVYSGPVNWFKQKTCGSALLQSLAGMFSKQSKFQNQINVFAKSFDADVAIDYVKNLPKRERADFFLSLSRLSDSDELFNKNATELMNKAMEKKLITANELDDVLGSLHGHTLYYFNPTRSKIYAQVDIHPEKLAIIDDILDHHELPLLYRKKYHQIFVEANFSTDELDLISKSIKRLPTKEDEIVLFTNYISFVNQYNDKIRKKALAVIDEVFDGATPLNSKYTKKFFRDVSKSEKYEINQYEKLLKKYQKENGGELTPALRKRAAQEAKAKRTLKDRLKYGCRTKNNRRMSFEDKALIAKRKANFTKFAAYSSIPLSVGSYALGHWDEEKDGEWYGKLSYEVGMGVIYSIFGAKFAANPSSNFFQKFWVSYKFNAIADIGSNSFYAMIFKAKDSEIQARVDELRKDPEFDAKVKELAKFVEDEKVYEKFVTKIKEILQIEVPEGMSEEEIAQLSPEDLENPEIREIVIALIVEQMYEEKSGELLVTGNNGLDRYSFYRLYSFLSIPKGVAIGIMMYRVMCMSPSPQRGMAIAISMLLFNKLVINPVEYKFRNHAIGQ